MPLLASLVTKVKALIGRGGPSTDAATSTTLRDTVATQTGADAAELSRRLAAGDITLTQFQSELYLATRNSAISQYALARGGLDAIDDADRATLGDLIGKQAGSLRDFVDAIGTGDLTAEQIAQRASLYADAGIEAHSRGQAAAMGVSIDDYPPLHPRCQCWLSYGADADGQTTVTWNLGDRPCPECVAMSANYQDTVPA